MPYIEQRARKRLTGLGSKPRTTGELNYLITKRIIKYINTFPRLSYDTFNFIMGVLDGIRAEMRNRNWGYYAHVGLEKDILNIIKGYLISWPMVTNHQIKQVRGVIMCIMFELYRRVISEYENLKCNSNGDVFDGLSP